MRHCKYHCAVCDAHFTSLAGFDAHIQYPICREAPRSGKKGKNPQYVQIEGVCDLIKGRIGQGVPAMIWRDSRERESALIASIHFKHCAATVERLLESPKVIPHPSDSKAENATGIIRSCSVCGQPIHKTGKRGRPRKIHVECKSE